MRSKDVKPSRPLPSVIYAPILREIGATPPSHPVRHAARAPRTFFRMLWRQRRIRANRP